MLTLEAVAKHAATLPGVTAGTRWGNRTWVVGERGFIWERPFSKADIKRFGDEPYPTGTILGVIVENLDAKDALLAMELPGFFTIEHFKSYPAVLIQLSRARAADIRAAITDAYRLAFAAGPLKPRAKAKAKRKRAR